ncbi:MAG TPA: cupin domain-containing protein [Edaphobacter sp.]|jgi:mannose-6-phosphate isomerase-like protein (cupin superfamily)|nr:cupin domain-containing protein [Edaphobacter sp.]
MREMTRREMCVGLSAIAATGGAMEAQTAAAPAGAATLSQAKVYPFEQMPARKMANGGESRDVLRGTLTTGEVIAVHESQQPAGMAPNTPHTIQHSEVMVVIQGTLLFEHDGKSDKVGPGGVIFVAPGTLHTVRNVGDGPAQYCVMQIGGDTKP